jgi:Bacterial sugar transferase
MRHPRTFHRTLSHPPRTGIRHGSRPPGSRLGSVHRATGPEVCTRSSPRSHIGGLRPADGLGRRSDVAPVLAIAAGLTAAVAAVSLLVQFGIGSGLLALAVLLAAAALAVNPRLTDRVLAALLGLLLLPVLLLLALAVGLSSRGPVLVRRTRHGTDVPGAPVLRFRTTAAGEPAPTARVENRFTLVGRILHGLSLDELPRLLDVARGEAPLLRTGHR